MPESMLITSNRVGCLERTASKHVYYLGWNRLPAQVGCMRQVLRPGALGRPRGIRWRGRWEEGSGWGTHVNPWLIHVNAWQKPLQYKKNVNKSQGFFGHSTYNVIRKMDNSYTVTWCIITKWGKCYVSRKEPRLPRPSRLLEKWCGGDAGVRSERQKGRVGAFIPACQCAWGGGLGSEQRPGCSQLILLPHTHALTVRWEIMSRFRVLAQKSFSEVKRAPQMTWPRHRTSLSLSCFVDESWTVKQAECQRMDAF